MVKSHLSVSQDCDPQVPSTIHLLLVHLLFKCYNNGFYESPVKRRRIEVHNHKKADENPREEVGNLKKYCIF